MNLETLARRQKESKNNKRLYTMVDMAIVKKDAAIRNSKIKRGELKRGSTEYIVVCGCGSEGCFIHGGHGIQSRASLVGLLIFKNNAEESSL